MASGTISSTGRSLPSPPTWGLGDGLIAAGAVFVVLLALLNNFLRFNGYPLMRPEIGLVVLVGIGAGLVFGLLYAAAGRVSAGRARIARAVLEGGFILYVADRAGASPLVSAFAGMIVAGIVSAGRRSTLPFFGMAAGMVIVLSSLGIGQQVLAPVARRGAASPATAGPTIVHIVLDEHIGPEGLPRDNPASAALARDLRGFYAAHGFRLFGGAYAEQFNTRASLPHILNFGRYRWPEPRNAAESMRDAGYWPLAQNAYFDALWGRGHALNVYQSEHIDYCAYKAVQTCLTYAAENLALTAHSPLTTRSKAWIILAKLAPEEALMQISWATRVVNRRLPILPAIDLSLNTRTTSLAAFNAFDIFIDDLQRARPGQAYFAHFIAPHFPFTFRRDCSLRERKEWHERFSPGTLRRRQDVYFEQVRCTMRKLDQAMAAIRRSPVGDDFVMIVHGDHGSRLTDTSDPRTDQPPASDKDMIASYSTLFAVRAPGMRPGYETGRRPVATMLKEWVARGTVREGSEPVRLVYLKDVYQTPRRRVPLPASW